MMVITPFKAIAGIAAVVALSTAVLARDWKWGAAPEDHMPIPMPTQNLEQLPFETPAFVPDQDTKIRALQRAYELNLTNDPIVHPELKKTEAVPEPAPPPAETRKSKLYNRDQVAPPAPRHGSHARAENTCTKHGLQKVEYNGRWRCRPKKI